MSYSTDDLVNILLGPHAITATTPLTLTELASLRDFVAAEIDATLMSIDVPAVPVTSADYPTFYKYLQIVEAWGVAAQVMKALFPEASGPGEQPAFAYWESKFEDAMKRIREGKIPIDIVGEAAEASSYFTENPDTEAALGTLAGASLFSVDDLDERPW